MSVYLPPDLKGEIERRAMARRMSMSEYALNLMLKGLDIERVKRAEEGGKAEEVH